MADNILNEIVPEGVNHQEALDVIISHFGGAKSTPNHQVEVPRDDPLALRIRTKRDQLVQIETGPGLKRSDITALQAAIHEKLVDLQSPFIAAHVFFSSRRVDGSFRCSDPDVQLLSASEDAPRPRFVLGEHPFVVEFPCTRSADAMITARRRMKLVRRWGHLLNLVLRSRISPFDNRSRWSWVLVDPESPHDVRFAQHYYSIPNFRHQREDFSSSIDPLPEIPHDDYYFSSSLALYGDQFTIPDSLSRTLNRIFRLPEDAQRRFFRAVHWLFMANAVWQDSSSASFVSTIAALESLIPRPTPAPKCSECGRDTGPGPTQLFRTLLDTYVPSPAKMRKVANVLYTVRSNLAHGEHMLLSDTEPFGRFDSEWLRELDTSEDLFQVSRVALINWLYAQTVA